MQTKKILGGLCLLLLGLLVSSQRCHAQCRVFSNLLTVTLNSDNSTISISGLSCEPCRVGFGENRTTCLCREDCKSLIPPESVIDETYNDCVEDCADEFPNDPNSYHHCLGYCSQLPYQSYYNCLSGCGHHIIERLPVAYRLRVELWYLPSFGDPLPVGDPEEEIDTDIVEGAYPPVLTLNLANTPIGPYGYCYFTQLDVLYDDGSCCIFTDFSCLSIG